MPILPPIEFKRPDQDEFRKLDYAVMRHAFDCHNELGRLCDEEIYQKDLGERLESSGLGPARFERPIVVTHGDFVKRYELDLIVADAVIYELKTAAALGNAHHRQLLNYLLLCEQPHGKLVNFRSPKVQAEFVNTRLKHADRLRFRIHDVRWRQISDRCPLLRNIL